MNHSKDCVWTKCYCGHLFVDHDEKGRCKRRHWLACPFYTGRELKHVRARFEAGQKVCLPESILENGEVLTIKIGLFEGYSEAGSAIVRIGDDELVEVLVTEIYEV